MFFHFPSNFWETSKKDLQYIKIGYLSKIYCFTGEHLKQSVKSKGRFPTTTEPSENNQLVPGQDQIDVFQVLTKILLQGFQILGDFPLLYICGIPVADLYGNENTYNDQQDLTQGISHVGSKLPGLKEWVAELTKD